MKDNVLSAEQNGIMATELGQAVLQLIRNGRRVTIGNIIDLLEGKRRAASGEEAEHLRVILTLIRTKTVP
ncbi:hypothetical protein DVF53_23400 [Salmonella enterica subsp. enterica serovar Kottbus]|nr:hypothetical protein [Salmonella enterica subsp. enterica serovar Kottbus]EHN5888482.1 hypothetical protein [Salmonella enterica subsp. enterica serovar Newport]